MTLLTAAERLPPSLRLPVTRLLCRKQTKVQLLDPDDFRDLRILVLGPARTVEDDLAGLKSADFDIVVKMNNGLDTPIAALGVDRLRCDVLFHSLTPDARPVTPEKLRQAKVRLLVHRTPTRTALLRTLMACERFGPICAGVRYLPHDFYVSLARELSGASPTTGLVCAQFFLTAPVREVAIMGFTFFQTCYVGGYDDQVATDADAVARILAKAHHAPGREAAIFARLVDAARAGGVTVTLGRHVEAAMHACGRD